MFQPPFGGRVSNIFGKLIIETHYWTEKRKVSEHICDFISVKGRSLWSSRKVNPAAELISLVYSFSYSAAELTVTTVTVANTLDFSPHFFLSRPFRQKMFQQELLELMCSLHWWGFFLFRLKAKLPTSWIDADKRISAYVSCSLLYFCWIWVMRPYFKVILSVAVTVMRCFRTLSAS